MSTNELHFSPGSQLISLTFDAHDDSIVENPETNVIAFHSSDDAVVDPIGSVSITINDNGDCKLWRLYIVFC